MRYVENGFCNGKKLISMLLLILILCGSVLGVWLVCSKSNFEYLYSNMVTQGFMEDCSTKTLLDVFLNSISWTSYILIIIYLCGYSAISQPICLLMLFLRGTALGISISAIYIEYKITGLAIFLLIMMFHAIASSVVLVFAVMDTLTQSTTIARTILGYSCDIIKVKKYTLRFLLYFIILLISSIVDTSLTYIFTDKLLF